MAVSANISRTRLDPAAPVVLVGQARSGSSLAALILNRFAGGFVVNDAYAAQMAEDLPDLDDFRAAALERIEARGWAGEDQAPIHRSARLSGTQRAAAAAARGRDWAELWGAMLHGAAEAGGCALWGWNTPPDHARAEEILAAFPRARFVFVMRDPWAVLRSYRNLPAHWGEERARYHPALQARAWAGAMRACRRLMARLPAQVHLLRYEDLLADPQETLSELAAFLGVPAFEAAPSALPSNASSPGGPLSWAEIAVARLALGAEAGAFPAPRAGSLGLGRLLRLTFRAGGYYGGRALRSRDMRGRILRMARA